MSADGDFERQEDFVRKILPVIFQKDLPDSSLEDVLSIARDFLVSEDIIRTQSLWGMTDAALFGRAHNASIRNREQLEEWAR